MSTKIGFLGDAFFRGAILRIFQSLFWCMGVASGVQGIGFFGTRALLGSTVDTCSSRAVEEFTYFLRCSELES